MDWPQYGGSKFQNPEVFPSHKTMFSPFYIYAYDLENFFYFQRCDRPYSNCGGIGSVEPYGATDSERHMREKMERSSRYRLNIVHKLLKNLVFQLTSYEVDDRD